MLFVIPFRFWVLLNHHYLVEKCGGVEENRLGLLWSQFCLILISNFATSKFICLVFPLLIRFWDFFFLVELLVELVKNKWGEY